MKGMIGMSQVDCRDWSVVQIMKELQVKFIISLTRTLQFRVEIPECVICLLKLCCPSRQNVILESVKLVFFFCFKKLCKTLNVCDPEG